MVKLPSVYVLIIIFLSYTMGRLMTLVSNFLLLELRPIVNNLNPQPLLVN